MSRRSQLVIILCAVASITAIISHVFIAWLGIETTFGGHWVTGPVTGKPSVLMAGSSLAGDGLSWRRIGDVLNLRIEGWAIAGSSPSEWEHFQDPAMGIASTVLVVSPYDLNEYFACDFRAEVAPLGQTVRDLWQAGADWPLCKRLLSQYPLSYLRILFPTAGRSNGVMVGVREKLRELIGGVFAMESEAGPTLSLNESDSAKGYKKEKISDWDHGRMLRRLADMHVACQGIHGFNGPKKSAFQRMLRQAHKQGRVVAVVLPVSPAYAGEFLSPGVKREFEELMDVLQRSVPEARWIRLDQLDQLKSNEYFWDLVHLNTYGQKLATAAFLDQIGRFPTLQ